MALVKEVGAPGPVHFTPVYICDRCQDESKEAFPYGCFDFSDLCNACFDALNETHIFTNVGTFERQPCQEDGCENRGEPCWIESAATPDEWYCAEHMHKHGFCIGCGQFYAGIESFDFGPGWCDNCAPEFEEEYDDDLDFGFEYGY